jgi:hypothetical protein
VIRLADLRVTTLIWLYVAIDVLCVGLGMGVPVFCIALGFPTGWVSARRALRARDSYSSDVITSQILRFAFRDSAVAAGITLAAMLVVWLPFGFVYFEPAVDLSEVGIPMILYTPRASFVAWEILMIIVAPVLQFLVSLSAVHVALMRIHDGE